MAVVVAIDLANASASRAFDLSVESVTGKTTHQIIGGPDGLDDGIYATLKRNNSDVDLAPVVSEYVSSPQLGNASMQLLGVDPFAEPAFRSYLGSSGHPLPTNDLVRFLTQPGAILISSDLAQQFNLKPEDIISLQLGGRDHLATIVGEVQPEDDLTRRALDGLIICDIATAQELTGRIGRLDRIDVIVPPQDALTFNRLAGELPPSVHIVPVASRTDSIRQMTDAFRVNLTALSLLALVVGMFLIYNTMTFSVVQRRTLFGILRCLGVTRRELFALVLGETLIVSVVGTGLGLGLGIILGQGAVRAVIQTINDLYFTVTVQGVQLPPASLWKGAALGISATLLSAVPPAWEASSIPPVAVLIRSNAESTARRLINLAALSGLCAGVISVAVLAIPTRSLITSFAGTFIMVIGFALLTPKTTIIIMQATAPMMGRFWGNLGRMAPRNVANAASRTTVAVAALMIAVSVTIGISLMVGSFRATVIAWLSQTLQSDIYISVPGGTATQPSTPVDPRVPELLQGWPDIQRMDTLRSVTVDSAKGPVHIDATSNYTVGSERIYVRSDRPPDQIWNALQQGAVLVSEPFATQAELPATGATLVLETDEGPKTFPVIGVYYDYSSSQGTVLMAQSVYQRLWHDTAITAIGLRLRPGADADTVARRLQVELGQIQHLSIEPNLKLRSEVLTVFDRTFAITGALQFLTTLVAFVGVFSTLLALEIEKQREMGILRTLGMSVRQMWGLTMLETGLMGAVAGLLAMPTGFMLAMILVYIINRRSFGWTLQMQIEPTPFIQAFLIAVVAALLAGLYPARRISTIVAADAVRFE